MAEDRVMRVHASREESSKSNLTDIEIQAKGKSGASVDRGVTRISLATNQLLDKRAAADDRDRLMMDPWAPLPLPTATRHVTPKIPPTQEKPTWRSCRQRT